MLLIGTIIAISIILIFNLDFMTIIVIVVCVVVLGLTFKVKKKEEEKSQEEVSPQHEIAQRESNMQIMKFIVGGVLIVIGIFGAIINLSGLGGLGVSIGNLNNLGGYILLGFLVGIPFIVFIVPGYFLVRSAYRKYSLSKQ
jgi:predicted membrane channel-forming protein YqfA (hemolysin III family)